jgi:DNA-binding transcriptional ArsR family regulator
MKKSLEAEACDCLVIHTKEVARIRKLLPGEEKLLYLADLFKVFGDSTRILILSALLHGELCVCDIAALLGMSKSAISHQLRVLRQSKLVRPRRDGKVVFYALDDGHVGAILSQGLEHVSE